MNTVFTIDALMDSAKQAWRLTVDQQQWRSVTFAENLHADDAILTDGDAVRDQLGLRMVNDQRLGLIHQGKAGLFDFLQRGIFTHAVVHRTGSAPLPNRAQLITTMAAMQPGSAQLIYLDLGGLFRSRPATGLVHNVAIAVRGEVASSAQFIGTTAAGNEAYISVIWQQFVAGWMEHLTSRRINCFTPNLEQCPPVEEALRKIAQFEPESMP